MRWTRVREAFALLAGRRRTAEPGLVPRREMPVAYAGAVVHASRSWRARVLQRVVRIGLKPLITHGPLNELTIRATRTIDRLSAAAPRSRFVEQVRFELGGVAVEEMIHRYGPDSSMTVLYLHGGGFISGGIETHRRICERLALLTGAPVISVDYVQLPEGNIAESVQDAINAYEGLVKETADPDTIVVAGDSAGGYLTMKVAELADRRGLPKPAALLLFSPMLSIDFDRPGKVEAIVEASDAYIPVRRVADLRTLWLPEDATIEGHTSPLNATSRISSPTFIVVADNEVLRPEAEALAHRLADRGVPVEFHLFRRQLHAFAVLADVMPESRKAIVLAADFARRAVGELADEVVETEFVEEPTVVSAQDVLDATVLSDRIG